MGCDIDLYLEYKSPITGVWTPFSYGSYAIPRNYEMFAKMAGVRSEGREAIFQAKGFPEDASDFVKSEYEKGKPGSDCCHDSSWLCWQEFVICVYSYTAGPETDILEYKALCEAMDVLEAYGSETRIVFWFIL